MTRIPILFSFALLMPLWASEEPQPDPHALRSGCSPDDEQIATVGLDDVLEVKQSLAGGDQACYRVTLKRGGQTLTGYVLGTALPAVKAFVERQANYRDGSFVAQQVQRGREEARAKSAAAAGTPAKLNPDMPASFEEFGGKDTKGKPVSLAGLGGRVILVTFWSPRSANSKGQLFSVLPLYNQYKRAGLRAVGICMDPNPQHVVDALDDITLGWPQIPDRTGLAKRYFANASTGTTLVLDASHRIVAAGLTPAELQQKVRELLSAQ